MVKKVLAGVAVVLLAFVAYVASRPSEFVITRKTTIAAPPEVIFGLVNDFHHWKSWSPWEELDPKMTTTYEGPAAGQGASYSWKGNDQVGEGKMTILESKPNEQVVIKLEFLKPFAATNTTTLNLVPGPSTEVTWKMEGKNNFMSKVAGVFMNMDEMIGKDFDKGLGKLKALSEEEAKKRAAPPPEAAAPPAEPAAAPPAVAK
ncbi:MAG: polyketide cyclase [Myxococcaceae bacterium]|nr:polyketide cyclase [Myxococcaceae bacterium]